MAKAEKLRKLKHSVLKKMNSFGRSGGGRVSSAASPTDDACSPPSDHRRRRTVRVWVGRSRREYEVNADVVNHPAFQDLIVGRSDDGCGITVGCEVVLFEHLLWMLESSGSCDDSPELLDDLADFYA